jgi:hypothetical protein
MSRFLEPVRWRSRSGVDLAALVLLAPLAWFGRTAVGRRLVSVAAVALAAAGLILALYAHPDASGVAEPVQARQGHVGHGGAADRLNSSNAATPEAAAVAWYARRVGVPPGRVRALQRQRVGAATVQVLVVAELGGGRLPSALITVRHGRAGWKVAS